MCRRTWNRPRDQTECESAGAVGAGTEFQRLIPAAGPCTERPECVHKLLLCSGKVFYDLRKAVQDAGLAESIAIARVEQLSPFPYDLLVAEQAKQVFVGKKRPYLRFWQESGSDEMRFLIPLVLKLSREVGIFSVIERTSEFTSKSVCVTCA